MDDRIGKPERATIQDVARHADVSIGTVSRVVAGSARVSDALRKRVLASVRELDYQPHGRAQPRPAEATRLIGFFVGDFVNLLYVHVVAAAEARLAQLGYTLLMASTREDTRREQELLSLLRERRIDGAVLCFGEETHPDLGQSLERLDTPVVVLDRQAPASTDSVTVDHRAGAHAAARYLIGLGHCRVGVLTAAGHLRPGLERVAGLRQAYEEAGLDFAYCTIRPECRTSNEAFAATIAMLDSREPPTAILTPGSQALPGTLRAIRTRGLKIPRDISLISFGDTEIAQSNEPPITTIRWDLTALGQQAVDLLLQRIDGRIGNDVRSIHIPTEIILRQSCASP
ncbi:LacI family DNA-binding transcriptional regulator [Agrobacterium sp. LAD9]|uniref:LacI family DNA-binding transcriptional regulator n=1 Tax=Agrobacterium sp. LAD9 TaxID=2055153 RepID=UPI000D1DDBF2|nr:substrate-binding domain-containing protein [Agrobacterium sp. LAD9]